MEFGKTLRTAREAKGYSISQLAEITRIMSQVIEGLENEDFKKIPAPIYGRGFVKLCCQALNLDPQPMIDEFMSLYNGEKSSVPTAAPVPPATKPVEPPKPIAPPEPQAVEPPKRPLPVGADEIPVPNPQRDLFERPAAPMPPPAPAAKPLSRFAPPTPEDDDGKGFSLPALPAIPWRLVFLLVGALAVIWILVIGCKSLYRVLNTPSQEPAVTVDAVSDRVNVNAVSDRVNVNAVSDRVKKTTAPTAKRTPKPVKPLYID